MAQKYRKVDPRIWNDEKFQTLPPEDKLVAIYCLTTSQANRIGLFSFSIAHASEDTGIHPETFRERFERVCQTLKWRFDNPTRTLYFPTWWKYNEPDNPNQLAGALKDIHDVPESQLVQDFLANERYLRDVISEPLRNVRRTFGEPSPNQEQEQEQEKDSSRPNRFADSDMATARWMFSLITEIQPNRKQPKYERWANDVRLMREQDRRSDREIRDLFTWANRDSFWRTNILSPSKLREKWDDLDLKRRRPHRQNGEAEITMESKYG